MNFGPKDTTTPRNVSYTSKLEPWPQALNGVLLTFKPANCSVSVAHTELTCTTSPGAGPNLIWSITVDGQKSVEPTTNYAVPTIINITNWPSGSLVTSANVLGGDVVMITGTNFGPPRGGGGFAGSLIQDISYGPTGREKSINLTSRMTYVSHNQVRLVLPPGIGTNLQFKITVADQESATSTARFSYAVPQIVRVMPNTARTFSDPTDPTLVTLQVRNVPLTDPDSIVRVAIGRRPYHQTLDLWQYPRTNATLQGFRNRDGTYNITVALPRNNAGNNTAVQLEIDPVNYGNGALFPTIYTAITSFTALHFRMPWIENVALIKTRWKNNTAGNSSIDAYSDIVFPCPFTTQTAVWNCSDST